MEWQEALERKGIKDRGGVTEKSGGMAGSIREEGSKGNGNQKSTESWYKEKDRQKQLRLVEWQEALERKGLRVMETRSWWTGRKH